MYEPGAGISSSSFLGVMRSKAITTVLEMALILSIREAAYWQKTRTEQNLVRPLSIHWGDCTSQVPQSECHPDDTHRDQRGIKTALS